MLEILLFEQLKPYRRCNPEMGEVKHHYKPKFMRVLSYLKECLQIFTEKEFNDHYTDTL